MTNITPLSDRPHSGEDPMYEINLDDPTGIGERFWQSFSEVVEEKKRSAVIESLQEEFPHLAEDENFVKKVVDNLGDNIVKEKRFVFLVLNPNLKK